MKESQGKRKRPFYNFLFLTMWVLIIVMFSGLIVTQAINYNELRAELERVEALLAEEEATIADLEMRLMFFDSDAHIERLARERLGMVRQNELIFVNIAN